MRRFRTPVILSEDKLVRARDYFLKQDAFVFDLESVGEHRGVPRYNEVTWLSMATHGTTVVVPMGHPLGSEKIGEYKEPRTQSDGRVKNFRMPIWSEPPAQLTPDQVFGILEPLFFSETIVKASHGLPTFDLPSLPKYYDGRMPPPPYECTLTLPWLVNENLRQYGLKVLTKKWYGVDYDHDNTGKKVEIWPFDVVAHYAYMDALYAWLVYLDQTPRIEDEEVSRVHQVERDLMGPLARMRINGMPTDVPGLEQLRDKLAKRQVQIEAEVYQAAGTRFNINSVPQKQSMLFGPLSEGGQGLKPWKLTDGGIKKRDAGEPEDSSWYSTNDEVLESFPNNDLACSLRDYMECGKLLHTYVGSWLGEEGNPKKPCRIIDGRLYTTLKQYGTVSGRFSSEQPNLQNVPRPDTEDGKLIRNAFVAPDGWLFAVADYGQIELVVLAHLIGHGALFDGFWAGIDPHTVTATRVWRKAEKDVLKTERQAAKTLNFSIVNGGGPRLVAAQTGMPYRSAKKFIKRYDAEFPEINEYKTEMFRVARRRRPPYVKTILGRKRRVPGLLSSDQGMRAFTERQTFNSLIQGGAADLIKLAIIETDRRYREELPDAQLCLTVHDEIVSCAPEDQAERAREILVESMTGPFVQDLIKVPLSVDAKVVKRWGDAK